MKPQAAPKPPVSGFYWVKIAEMTHDNVAEGFNWKNPKISDWQIVYFEAGDYHDDGSRKSYCLDYFGSDNIGKWDDEWEGIVIEVKGPILNPDGL